MTPNAAIQDDVKPRNSEITPPELVSRIVAGDTDAEQSLVNHYWRNLLFILNRRTQNLPLAQDIAQDAFVIVIENLRQGKLKDPSALGAYIRSTGQNLLIAHYRKETRRDTHSFGEHGFEIPDNKPGLLQQVNAKQALELVQQVINELNAERDRQLLVQYYLHEQDKKAVCQNLSLTPDQFDRVLHRARNRLKSLIEHKHGPELFALGTVDVVSLILVLGLGLLITEERTGKKNSIGVGESVTSRHPDLIATEKDKTWMTAMGSQQGRDV